MFSSIADVRLIGKFLCISAELLVHVVSRNRPAHFQAPNFSVELSFYFFNLQAQFQASIEAHRTPLVVTCSGPAQFHIVQIFRRTPLLVLRSPPAQFQAPLGIPVFLSFVARNGPAQFQASLTMLRNFSFMGMVQIMIVLYLHSCICHTRTH